MLAVPAARSADWPIWELNLTCSKAACWESCHKGWSGDCVIARKLVMPSLIVWGWMSNRSKCRVVVKTAKERDIEGEWFSWKYSIAAKKKLAMPFWPDWTPRPYVQRPLLREC